MLEKIDDILERMAIQNKMFTILVDEMYYNRNKIKQCFAQLQELRRADLHNTIEGLNSRLQRMENIISDFENIKRFTTLRKMNRTKLSPYIVNVPSCPIELSLRQQKALKYIKNNGQITNKEYRELYKVSQSTAVRELKQMVEASILERFGSARNTFYKLNP